MARNYVRYRPNRGLNIVQPKAALNAGQCYRAENVVFTRKSVKRRPGKLASHKVALTSVSAAVTLLKRFYNLATTGTVSKVFLKAFGAVLYGTTTDWSDDTRTPITTAQWTNIPYPNTTNNSLYSGYSSTTSVPLSGGIASAVASKSWCYIQSNVSSADDNGNTTAVAIRTQGGKAFLHGLPPPSALVAADTEHSDGAGPITWTLEAIESSTDDTGDFIAIAVDASGTVHVAYSDDTANTLRYATGSASGFTATTIESITVGGATGIRSVSIALNSLGDVFVVYIDNGTNDLKMASKSASGSAWQIETVTSATNVDACSVAVGPNDVVHIAFQDDINAAGQSARYATRASALDTWTLETIDAGGVPLTTGFFISIAVGADGFPRVAYFDDTNDNLRYATRASGSWVAENVDTTGNVGRSCSLALDSSDIPAIIYQDITNSTEKFAYRLAGSWSVVESIESVGSSITVGSDHALAFGDSDIPYAAYVRVTSSGSAVYESRIAKKVSGSWTAATIDSGTAAPALAIDDNGDLHVAYEDARVDPMYAFGEVNQYFYRLTAEYDGGILGESGPSDALGVSLADAIDSVNSHTLDLDDAAARYDMTDDVSRIFVYRTVRGSTSDGPYYRVGSVSCTTGAPTADFTDDVTDAELVLGRILDTDRYMPPKWRTGVFWKDRLVIGNLKCRKLNATEGDRDSLDLEEDGIHKNRIRFSEGFHPDVFKANFFQDILPDGDSGSIQRLIVNPQSDSLFVFLENDVVALVDPVGDTVTSLSYRPRNVANSHGTPARHSVVEYEGLIFYWTKNGIEVINGLTARNITSDTIGNLWNMTNSNHPAYASRINMSQISKVAGTAHVDEAGERIYWAYPAASNSYNNRVLVLDFARWRDSGFNDDGVFSIWTMDISCWARWDGEGDRGELFGGEALNTRGPWVHRVGISNQDEVGNTSGTITTSAVSPFYIHTGHDDAGTAERRKRWITARVDGRIPSVASTGSCSVALAFDVDEGAVSGTMDTVTWTQGGIKRYSRNLPRAAIGVHGAVEITGTDGTPGASGGSPPFELYEIAMTVQDMEARTARG